MLPELARRLSGSADLFESSGRGPCAGINFVTAHDGFTLKDLVSYARKHNEANGEGNRDGHADEKSANHGIEGETHDPAIRARRLRQRRNLLATLLLGQGTPMLLMGDELGRSQRGNNNAYCQDNEISWLDWRRVSAEDAAFADFAARLVRLRRRHPALRRRRFLHGRRHDANGVPDIAWFAADGRRPGLRHWHDPHNRCLGVLLGGGAGPELDREGRAAVDATLLLLLNAHDHPVAFALPSVAGVAGWRALLDTAAPAEEGRRHEAAGVVRLEAQSLVLLAGE